MRNFLRHGAWALALTISGRAFAGASSVMLAADGTPSGFDELASAREVLVDVYFGDRKISEARATTKPGRLQFKSPSDVLGALKEAVPSAELVAALAGDLPTNAQAVCSRSNSGDCGVIAPDLVGIIYDEDRFRVDLFINPRFLKAPLARRDGFLPTPSAALSLTNSFGVAASGTIGGRTAYNLQNRTIVGLHSGRLRADTSVASGLGLLVDDFVAEVDRRELRYSAGLFWAPGNEFTGQRRIIGVGVGTQFDTREDQQAVRGTPLIVFLAQPARVELLVDGRLVSARSYPAGNNDIDTSALTDGSYPVVVRIHLANGSVQEERRFFVKNAQVAPVGHPIFYAYGGLLANTRAHRPLSPSDTFYYQLGSAWRLNNSLAVDVAALGTQHKAILEAGAWLLKGTVRVRAAGLASSAGDSGALMQLSAGGHGPLSVSFDVRRIWSHDGKPLIGLPTSVDTFGVSPATGVQLAVGSYTQATGSLGLRIGDGFISVVGSYRKDRKLAADYTIGPSISWPIVTRKHLQLVLDASAQRTRNASAGFAGLRLLFASGSMSMLSSVGQRFESGGEGPGSSTSRVVSSFNAQYSHETEGRTLVHVEGGIDRDIRSSTVHGATTVASDLGNLRADLLHGIEGVGGTQYSLSFQSGVAVAGSAASWGSRDIEQSAILVSVGGDAAAAMFDVLVDDSVRGRVKTGGRLSLFLPGYRTYRVRLVPAAASSVSYDSGERKVTLYPGNVQSMGWRADSTFTIFARAVLADGSPVANALVQAAKSTGETDANGYFQIDVRRDDVIEVLKGGAPACRIALSRVIVRNDFASLGKVVCQ